MMQPPRRRAAGPLRWPALALLALALALLPSIHAQAAPARQAGRPPAPPPLCSDGQNSLGGTVRSAAGEPVANMQVFLVKPEAGRPPSAAVVGWVMYQATTGADGTYLVDKVCDDGYYVMARPDPAQGHGFYDADGDHQPDLVTLGPDRRQATGIDITLSGMAPRAPSPPGSPGAPPSPLPGCRADPGTIEGTVSDATGAAAAGARVLVIGEDHASATRADGEGRYRVPGLCAGSYLVIALQRTGSQLLHGIYDPDGDGQPDPVDLAAGAMSATGIDITVRPLGVNPFAALIGCPQLRGLSGGPQGVLDQAGDPASYRLAPGAPLCRAIDDVASLTGDWPMLDLWPGAGPGPAPLDLASAGIE